MPITCSAPFVLVFMDICLFKAVQSCFCQSQNHVFRDKPLEELQWCVKGNCSTSDIRTKTNQYWDWKSSFLAANTRHGTWTVSLVGLVATWSLCGQSINNRKSTSYFLQHLYLPLSLASVLYDFFSKSLSPFWTAEITSCTLNTRPLFAGGILKWGKKKKKVTIEYSIWRK